MQARIRRRMTCAKLDSELSKFGKDHQFAGALDNNRMNLGRRDLRSSL